MRTPPTKTDTSARLFALVACLAAFSATPGCKSEGTPLQVCHVDSDSEALEVLTIGGEAELRSHLAHGDPLFGTGLDTSCGGTVTFGIDTAIEPGTVEVAGLRGGEPRPVAALVGPNGGRDEYVANEIQVHFDDARGLEGFLTEYGGTVLMDDLGYFVDDDGVFQEVPGGADGWRLIRIDPSTSELSDLPDLAVRAGLSGAFSASSDAALRVLAVHLREGDRNASVNHVAEPHALLEHPIEDPNVDTVYWDMSTEWWMTDDDDPATPGDQGVSVGTARALAYLRHTGYPPQNGVWTPARVAIIDQGFDLDEVSGIGNRDYNNGTAPAPLQIDLQAMDNTAGGVGQGNWDWHGQGSFGACCASPRNGFGGAGSGGEYVRPILIKFDGSATGTATAIDSAMRMGAQVISMSYGTVCNAVCPLSDDRARNAQKIRDASDGAGIALFASAGNGTTDNQQTDLSLEGRNARPCEHYGVICVGAIDSDGDNVWNWGDVVDIWAPTNVRTTVSPRQAAEDDNDWGKDEVRVFGGTSCSSPFAAGIAGLMKSVAPDYPGYLMEDILKETANQSDDPMVVTGYVDALRAVQSLRGNPAPTVRLAFINSNGTYSPLREHQLSAHLSDNANPRGFVGRVEFFSNVDGLICSQEGDANFMSCMGHFPTQGVHVITGVATDEFGASTSTEGVSITVDNDDPSVALVTPADGSTHYASQTPSFRATVYDFDAEDFTSFCPAPDDGACTEWRSDIDGILSSGAPGENALNFSSTLSQGTHMITVTVWDRFGASSSESVTVTVAPGLGRPSARIVTPLGSFTWREPTVLVGSASDPEDGPLPSSSFEWYSSVDEFLGTGSNLPVDFSGPECESSLQHVITLRVVDSDGNVGTDEIRVTFNNIC